MAEVKAEKDPLSMDMHQDILASEMDVILERGTPLYYSLTKAISEEIRPFLMPGARVVDLFSHGGIWIEQVKKEAPLRCRFLSINSCDEDKERCKDSLRMSIHLGEVIEFRMDLSCEFPDAPSDVVLSLIGLSSIEEERRVQLLRQMFAHMPRGGALILADRTKDIEGGNMNWPSLMKGTGFKETRRFWQSKELGAWIAIK